MDKRKIKVGRKRFSRIIINVRKPPTDGNENPPARGLERMPTPGLREPMKKTIIRQSIDSRSSSS